MDGLIEWSLMLYWQYLNHITAAESWLKVLRENISNIRLRHSNNVKRSTLHLNLFYKYLCLFSNQYLVRFNVYNVEIDKKQIKHLLSSCFIISLYFSLGCPNGANPDDIC